MLRRGSAGNPGTLIYDMARPTGVSAGGLAYAERKFLVTKAGITEMAFKYIKVPGDGEKIRLAGGKLHVPDRPIIPFIEGDGTGPDIWRASQYVFDHAVEKVYGGKRKIAWMEVYAGEKPFTQWKTWLPDEAVEAFQEYLVGIKGPLTTPIGGGIRSLNVALRQMLDLYVCLRPVRYFAGVPSPVKHPEKLDSVIFRENTEDIYAGIEWAAESAEAKKLIKFLQEELGVKNIRFPNTSGIGIKPVSREGSERLIRAALDYALAHKRKSVTFVHKGNIMKFTEGACGGSPPAGQMLVKDAIADITLQQILTRPEEFDVVATLNLNGDYLSDAMAAQVGGIGIAPGANINYVTGHAIFEATHGTAPKYANQDKVNPGSVILSGVLMFEHLGWQEVADGIVRGIEKTIANKTVTYDFERQMSGAKLLKCSEFGKAIVDNM